jgi:serine/threonine protein kinase
VAPEQLRGEPVDNRSDLFAAAAVLFEALTGVKPFRAKTVAESISLMESRGPEDICALNPLVPRELKQVIDRALAFDPAWRFASASEFSQAIAGATPRAPTDTCGGRTAAARPSGAAEVAERRIWGAALLHRIERELATFVGPLASLAVRESSKATSDAGTLLKSLADYIDNERDRRQFLQTGKGLAAWMPDQTGSSPSMRSTGGATPPAAGSSSLPPLAVLAEIEESLTCIIGPIAKIVVKEHLRNFATLPQLYQALAADIPSERDRTAFLESLKSR